MSIKYAENPTTPLDINQFHQLGYKSTDFVNKVTITRRRPKFIEHDLQTNTSSNHGNFNVFACTDKIVRVYVEGGHLYSQILLPENDNQTTLNSWSTATDVSSGLTLFHEAPSLIGYETSGTSTLWKVAAIYTRPGGLHDGIRLFHSTDAITWTEDTAVWNATWPMNDSAVRPPNWYVVKDLTFFQFVGLAAGSDFAPEVIYMWGLDPVTNSERLCYYFNGAYYSTDIAYPYGITGFDVQVINDPSFDHQPVATPYVRTISFQNGYLSKITTRHVLVVSTQTSPYYTYTLINNVPVPTPKPSGGIISWCVIPPEIPNSDMVNPAPWISVGVHDIVETFQPLTPQLARLYPRINTTNSYYDPAHNADTIYCTCFATDGDNNQNDTSYSYNYLAYYTSRDGIHWSQPEPLLDANSYTGGTAQEALASHSGCLVKLGHYLYLISANGTMRSPTPSGWMNPHPAYTIDVSSRVMSYTRDFSDMSQTRISLDNRDGNLWSTFLLQEPADFDIVYQIGTPDYQQVVSIEQVDSIAPSLQQPDQTVDISSRGAKANLTDRFKSTNAILHDNPVARIDTYAQTGGVANSGLGHSAVQSGSWSTTEDGYLHLQSNHEVGVEFATFKDMVEHGSVQVALRFALDPAISSANGWAGICFRGLDKFNWGAVIFDPVAGGFFATFSWKGISSNLPGATYVPYGPMVAYNPPSGMSPDGVNNYAFSPLTDVRHGSQFVLRIEFMYNLIKVLVVDPFGHIAELGQIQVFGLAFQTDPAIIDHIFTTGYIGLVGYGYSDEDSGLVEATPSAFLSATVTCGTDRSTFHIKNNGGTATPAGAAYQVTDQSNNIVVSGTVSLSPGATMDVIAIAIGTLTLTVTG